MSYVVFIGTSGWQYDHWKGRFYPRDLPKSRWLGFFGARFPTVEVNNSFYRLPSEDSFARWRNETPPGFVVAVKASRYITHIKRLSDPKDPLTLFWSRARLLREKLGPVLFQLPPRFRADVPRLTRFLEALPSGIRAAFEFRDASWETEEVFTLLDRKGTALVIPDRPGLKAPIVVTGGWSYVRFHQGGRATPSYTMAKLRRWADRIEKLQARDIFIYFNNDSAGAALRDADALRELLERRGQNVARASHLEARARHATS
jgi:uncharacterized protein YecE (DUF72 family)